MNSTPIFSFLIIILLCYSVNSYSQVNTNKKVTLIEKQNGKRLELYAKNTDTLNYVVFLRVTTQDYRRTSKRPVLKSINPNSETHLLTLIKLAGAEGKYEKQFIVNEVSQNLKFRKDNEDIQVNFNNALKTKKIIIYQSDNCSFCEATKALFNENKIAFQEKHIIKDKSLLERKLKELGESKENLEQESLIIQIESKIYKGITNKKQLLEVLKKHI